MDPSDSTMRFSYPNLLLPRDDRDRDCSTIGRSSGWTVSTYLAKENCSLAGSMPKIRRHSSRLTDSSHGCSARGTTNRIEIIPTSPVERELPFLQNREHMAGKVDRGRGSR